MKSIILLVTLFVGVLPFSVTAQEKWIVGEPVDLRGKIRYIESVDGDNKVTLASKWLSPRIQVDTWDIKPTVQKRGDMFVGQQVRWGHEVRQIESFTSDGDVILQPTFSYIAVKVGRSEIAPLVKSLGDIRIGSVVNLDGTGALYKVVLIGSDASLLLTKGFGYSDFLVSGDRVSLDPDLRLPQPSRPANCSSELLAPFWN